MPDDELEAKQFAESMNRCISYLFLLKKGPAWSPDETPEIDKLQEDPLANLRHLGEMGILVLNGPLLDSFAVRREIRGVGVIKADSMKEAEELLDTVRWSRLDG